MKRDHHLLPFLGVRNTSYYNIINIDNFDLQYFAAVPSPPLLTYSDLSFGIGEYSVAVQWHTLSDAGGVKVDNYTLILYHDEIIIDILLMNTSIVKHILFLNYFTNYSIEVHASNCIGTGNLILIYIFKGKILVWSVKEK